MILPRTTRLLAVFVMSGVTTVGGACAPARSIRPDPIKPSNGLSLLSWIGEFTRPAGTVYPQLSGPARFGSLSGLVHDPASGQWVSVIDDREDSRLAWLTITAAAGRLEVAPVRLQFLRAGPGVEDRIATQADLEAIVVLPDGSILVSEEGHVTEDGVWPPAILQVSRDGVVTGVVAYPREFQISADGTSGIRDNQGFESLTLTPRGRLIAGLEQPLSGQPITTSTRGGEGRLVEFQPSGATWKPGRQWEYAISPAPTVKGFPTACDGGENGLVELLAITETMLLAMERACWLNAAGDEASNAIQLFAVTLSGNTARKTLLLDLSTLVPKLSPVLAHLENFEGLALGPNVGGWRTLLVVSDDNFRATQKTAFLLFGMR